MDDLSYDELELGPADRSLWPTGLVVLAVALLGAPQVWDALRSGDLGPALFFFPVLVLALGSLAVRR